MAFGLEQTMPCPRNGLPLATVWQSKPRRVIGYDANQEPPLQELLEDPILHRLLRSDNIALDQLESLVTLVKRRLRAASHGIE